LHLVWEDSVKNLFKKAPTYWCFDSGTPMPTSKTEYYLFSYEAMDLAMELVKKLSAKNTRYFIIVDESHNFADPRSARTQKLVDIQTYRDDAYFIWTTGTPILKLGTELISFLKCADPRFDTEAERRFKSIFSTSKGRANEIFNHRLGEMMAYMVSKAEVSDTKPTVKELPIKLPTALANRFLMKTVREDMKKFIEERVVFYQKDMANLRAIVNKWLEYHKSNLTTKEQEQRFNKYLKDLKVVSRNPDQMIPELQNSTRYYERNILLPSLPPTERKAFKSALSAIKNIKLKVRGEALGKVLAKRRSECAAALGLYCKPEQILKESLSKTLFFASSVYPVETLARDLERKGFKPARVFGDTNKDLTKIMTAFKTDPLLNPICATMQSLSEAVPVIEASTEVLLNRPFRQATWDQIISRADRNGQIHPVTVIEVTLDTGGEENVSSRTDDILREVRSLIKELVGDDFAGPSPDDRVYQELIDSSSPDSRIEEIDELMGL
jgi:SNF2 family DNA or RNA helicase